MRLLSWKFAQTESRNNMKKYYVLISRVYERIISQNTRKGMKFPFIPNMEILKRLRIFSRVILGSMFTSNTNRQYVYAFCYQRVLYAYCNQEFRSWVNDALVYLKETLFSLTKQCFQLLLTVPGTSASAERSFSKWKLVKLYAFTVQ